MLALCLAGVLLASAGAALASGVGGVPVSVVTTSGEAFGGSAGVPLVSLDALDIPGVLDVAAAAVAPAESVVDSAGVSGAGVTGEPAGTRSYAHATNVAASLLSGAIAPDLLQPVTQATAAGDPAAATAGVLDVPAASLGDLAGLDVVANSAHAAFATTRTCSTAGEPLSQSGEQVADAQVLPLLSGGGAVAAVDDTNGGTVQTSSLVELRQAAGQVSHEGVVSTAETQLTDVNLFGGQVQLEVLAPPTVTATATGEPGGATVTYNEPDVRVLEGTKVLGTLSPTNTTIPLPLLGSVSLGTLSAVKTASNGTSASGSASLVTVSVDPLGVLPALSLAIAPATVSASVPTGGVSCTQSGGGTAPSGPNPLSEAHKDLSAATVPAGQSFDYTITVPNRGTCTLSDVTVSDPVPSGLTFDSSVPAPTSDAGGVLTYALGSLGPNATREVTLAFTVPAGTATGTGFSNHATVTGSCGSTPYSKGVAVSGPTAGPVGTGACSLSQSNTVADHTHVKPGETFNYYVHLYNTGSAPCPGVSATDTLQPGVGFVSCTDDCTHSGTTVVWPDLGTLGPGQSKTLTVTVVTTADSGVLSNVATVAATGTAPVTLHATGPTVGSTSVLAPPDPATFTATTSATSPGSSSGTPAASSGSLPYTGSNPLVAVVALVLLSAALVMRWLRRTTGPDTTSGS